MRILLLTVFLAVLTTGPALQAALVNCPECQRQVSDQASQCPGCGLPGHRLRSPGTGFTPDRPRPTPYTPAREPAPWADTADTGPTEAPFSWTVTGATMTASAVEGVSAKSTTSSGARLQLRVRAPSVRGRMVIQFVGRANGERIQYSYGNESANRRPDQTYYFSRSDTASGDSASIYLYTSAGETPVVTFQVPTGELVIERVRVFWVPVQSDGSTAYVSPGPLTAAPRPKAVTAGGVQGAVLIVQAGEGTGSGFLARRGTEVFIYTNQHVLGGAKSVTFRNAAGKSFVPASMEIAEKEDLVRLALNAEDALTAGDVLQIASGEPRIGEPVSVYGNSQGSGTVTELGGQVLSVGPQLIEVSALFVEGNSGGPICNARGEVVGVTSFVRRGTDASWVSADSSFARNRRFGYRVTPAVTWTKVQPQAFLAQARAAEDALLFLGILAASLEHLKVVPSATDAYTPFLDMRFIKEEADKAFHEARWSQQLAHFTQRFAYVEGKSDRRLNPNEVQRHVLNLKQEYVRLADLAAAEAGKTRWMSGYLRERAAQVTALAAAIRNHVNTVLSGK